MVILGIPIHGTMTTSSKSDYLAILGLSNNFDNVELKKAFRREARKWHPDLNKNDVNAEERFKLINEAYEYLRNPSSKNFSFDKNDIVNGLAFTRHLMENKFFLPNNLRLPQSRVLFEKKILN